ncbi:MAG: tyrosine--tRNA ligase [Clostridia bacterium]|nr:tyrosine--tRNA ligase [Clostridia bacterium]
MAHILDVLAERGFIKQVMHEEELRERMAQGPMTFYVGFDPTADSLHVGHFIPIMAMAHLQRAGHRPIALVGGGTCMIGDPSGKADMRKMLTVEQIDENVEHIKGQLSRFIDFDNGAIMVNNADWLRNLNYIEFLRDIGVHFNVNRMLQADCFKVRMERDAGLTFLEFNYMLMQGYDFYRLHKDYDCSLQCGGDDQWSNMIAGANLIRKKDQQPAFALTFALLTNSQGQKMGKTVAGALWLDENKTSPYDFYQYWRNVEDDVVEKCLALLTFLPMDEVRRLGALEGAQINEAKKVLAFEVTKIVHGEEKAMAAKLSAESLFGGAQGGEAPVFEVAADQYASMRIVDLLAASGLCKSKSEARKMVESGAVTVDGEKVTSIDFKPEAAEFLLRRGKKQYKKIIVK